MAKPFSIYTLIRGKEPLLRQMACEFRYHDGQLYLDRSGRLLKQLVADSPDWIIAPDPTAQGTSLYNIRIGTRLAFSLSSTSLVLDKSSSDEVIAEDEVASFLDQVDSTFGLIVDELEITEFLRIGYREQFHFPFEKKEDSEKWLGDLGLFTVAPSLYGAFSSTPEALSFALLLQGEECRYRIALTGMERSAQIPIGEATLAVRSSTVHENQRKVLMETLRKERQRQINSAFAVVLDIDAFLLEPREPDMRRFVEEHAGSNLKLFRESLPKEPPKKGKR